MKRNAIETLIKDVIIAVIGWAIFSVLVNALIADTGSAMSSNNAKFLALLLAGLPFGWRWASKIITAVSLKGVGIKLVISVLLGSFAIFIVLIFDVIRCFTAKPQRVKRVRNHLEQ